MSTLSAGLRELKKQRTRQAISDHATRLFLEHGYDRVTIAQIAEAAEVSKMTVTNYFPRKEDLALDLGREYAEGLARTVRDRPSGRSALDALREDFLTSVARHDPVIGFCGRPFARMIAGSPALLARLREFHEDRERALAAALAEEAGTSGPDDFRPRATAALIAAAHRALFDETFRRTLAGQSDATIAAAVTDAAHHAFALLATALGPRS